MKYRSIDLFAGMVIDIGDRIDILALSFRAKVGLKPHHIPIFEGHGLAFFIKNKDLQHSVLPFIAGNDFGIEVGIVLQEQAKVIDRLCRSMVEVIFIGLAVFSHKLCQIHSQFLSFALLRSDQRRL